MHALRIRTDIPIDSRQLQYLSQDDFLTYIKSLEENLEHFLHDPMYIRTFHETWLSSSAGESKKQTESVYSCTDNSALSN
jgi:hypothetical protein